MTNTDLLTIGYNVTGKMFRNSIEGRLLKLGITSNLTKLARDKLLDKFEPREHYKRYVQYLTGGQVLNKTITELPANVKQEIIDAHKADDYPERKTHYDIGPLKGKPNKSYNPKSNLLSTYNQSNQTAWSLGHVQYIPDGKGGYTMTDTYKVDKAGEFAGEDYKPFRTKMHPDLLEGGRKAAYAYDLSKWLGINRAFKYNVKFSREDLKIKK